MDNDYFLVSWIQENPIRYSVMTRNDIVELDDRLKDGQHLINHNVAFKWNKKQICIGHIISIGRKDDLEVEMGELISNMKSVKNAKATEKRKRKCNELSSSVTPATPIVVAKRTAIDSIVQRMDVSADDEKSKQITELTKQLEAEREKSRILQDEINNLKAQQPIVDGNLDTDIGNGVFINRQALSTIRTVSSTVNIYARNIFKHLFETHEILGCSLMGKQCNANKDLPKQPSVDPIRRDAIIGHALQAFGKKSGSELYKLGMKDLKKSLSSLIVEMTNEAKQMEANLLNS